LQLEFRLLPGVVLLAWWVERERPVLAPQQVSAQIGHGGEVKLPVIAERQPAPLIAIGHGTIGEMPSTLSPSTLADHPQGMRSQRAQVQITAGSMLTPAYASALDDSISPNGDVSSWPYQPCCIGTHRKHRVAPNIHVM
jgi:hypothetical protein